MKLIKTIFIFQLLTLILIGCVENKPDYEFFPGDRINFTYQVEGSYAIDYLVGSPIKFINISEEKGTITWDFGDGSPTITDAEPTHKYEEGGIYKVTLTIEGIGSLTKSILISDIFPTVEMVPIEGGVCEVNLTPVEFTVSLPNPEELPVEYVWIFPEGTIDERGNDMEMYVGENPGKIIFRNVGSQKVTLNTKLGGRELQETVKNVQVGYNEPVKTIYYAVKKGNLMALKIIPDMPSDMRNQPFDLGIKSGQTPMNILFDESYLYVLDPGKQFTYVNDEDGVLGDGSISAVKYDSEGDKFTIETVLTNSNEAFNDPFYGHIDGDYLYFTDRNTGIRRIDKSSRNMSFDAEDARFVYYVKNELLLYYNLGYSYGAMNACFSRQKDGTWWWAKTYNGEGLFRFQESDIQSTSVSAGERDKPYPVVMSGVFIKSFVIDEDRGMIYYAIRSSTLKNGFYKASLDEVETLTSSNPGTLVQEMISNSDGASGEYVDICQMVLDPEDGSVYFGYRKDDSSSVPTGLKRYNPETNSIETLIEGVEIYGVTIDHTKSKLF